MKCQNSAKIVPKIIGWLGGRMIGRTRQIRTADPHHVKLVPFDLHLIDFISFQYDFSAHLASLSAGNEIKDLLADSGKDFLKFETRGFESIATNHDTSKNNNLANSKKLKTTSNNLKTSSSAYTPHTLISKRDLT